MGVAGTGDGLIKLGVGEISPVPQGGDREFRAVRPIDSYIQEELLSISNEELAYYERRVTEAERERERWARIVALHAEQEPPSLYYLYGAQGRGQSLQVALGRYELGAGHLEYTNKSIGSLGRLSQSRNLNRTLRMTRWACRVCKDEPS
jgi:hypothetical protein